MESQRLEESATLSGSHIRLAPLTRHHAEALTAAAAADSPVDHPSVDRSLSDKSSLYQWSPVPRNPTQAEAYIETALAWRDAGTALPFVILDAKDDAVIGSTRFWNIERWAWPPGHLQHGRSSPDACEIGYTWFTRSAIRTAANTEAKLLMLTHAFEVWKVFRVCFHTDARNQRSRAALERIGGKFEGILRAHRMAADFIPRDSVRYSILAEEWPEVKSRLCKRLESSS